MVMFDRSNLGSFAHRKAFTPFDELIVRDGYDKGRFSQANLGECHGLDGKLYGFPRHFVTRFYFLNADHFKDAGLDADKGIPDWNTFKEAGVKLTKKDSAGKITRLGIEPHVDNTYTWGWSNGGKWASDDGKKATMDDPKNIEGFEFALGLADALGGQETISAFTSSFQVDANDPFITGLTSMKFMGNTFLRNIARYKPDMNLRTTFYPMKSATDPRQTWIAGHAWVIPRGTKELEPTWALLKTYMEWDSIVAFQEAEKAVNDKLGAPYLPIMTAQPVIDQRLVEKYKSNVPLIAQGFQFALDILTKAPQVLIRPRTPATIEMWDASLAAFDETLRKKKPASQALKDANTKIQKVIDDAWANPG
jgi:multiple sugar transport system permease protein